MVIRSATTIIRLVVRLRFAVVDSAADSRKDSAESKKDSADFDSKYFHKFWNSKQSMDSKDLTYSVDSVDLTYSVDFECSVGSADSITVPRAVF